MKARGEMQWLFEEGIGHDRPEVRGTAWAAYDAVTAYIDHFRAARGHDDTSRASRRLDSLWFGSGAKRKAKAWDSGPANFETFAGVISTMTMLRALRRKPK